MSSYRAQGLLAAGLGAFALAACGDPELNTNLRPDGPPDVLAVMVMTDVRSITPVGTVPVEAAMYCKEGDTKVPTFVGFPNQDVYQVCPEIGTDEDLTVPPVENADPRIGQVRIVFDELIDTDVEELLDDATGGPCTESSAICVGTIANTQPVILRCGADAASAVEVPYDGYYVPNGNQVSWPPGPSLVVFPAGPAPGIPGPVATGTYCEVELDPAKIVDKSGNAVPSAQVGPYAWTVADLRVTRTSPVNPTPEGGNPGQVAATFRPNFQFNAAVDPTSIDLEGDDAELTVTDDNADGAVVTVTLSPNATSTTLQVVAPAGGWTPGHIYTVKLRAGSTIITTQGGSTLTIEMDIVRKFRVAG